MLSLFLAVALLGEVPHPLRPLAQGVDVLSYNARIVISQPSSLRIDAGVNRIILRRSNADDSTLFIHLRSLSVDSVFVDGVRGSAFAVGTLSDTTFHYRIALPQRPLPAIDTVDVYYSGVMSAESGAAWGGVHYDDRVLYALGVGFNNASVSATQHWLPVLDHPGDKALFAIDITVPDSLVAVSNGLLVGSPTSVQGMTTYSWKMSDPCATYLLTFAVGPFVGVDLAPADTLPHVAYVQAADTLNARITMRLLPRMRRVFERWFGAYPFEKVGYVSTQKGAMEHQTMISLNTSVVKSRDTANSTVAHELAHQWFGDMVTPVDFRHAWLTESFATYCELLWIEDLYGYPAYIGTLDQRVQRYFAQIVPSEGVLPLFNFRRNAPSSNYPQTIYQKGAVIIGMLRSWLGDVAFKEGLRAYLSAHRYANADTDDLRKALEASSGKELRVFFQQWIESEGWPILSVNMTLNDGNWTATFTQVQQKQNPSWPLYQTIPLSLLFREPVSNRLVDTLIVLTDQPFSLTVDSPSTVRVNNGTAGRSLVAVGTITSVDTFDESNGITLSPNPADRSITLLRSNVSTATDIRITDTSGALRVQRTWALNANRMHIDISELGAGAYFVHVGTNVVPLAVQR